MILFILVFKHVEEHLKDLIKHAQYLTIVSQCSEEYVSEIIQLMKRLYHRSYKDLNQKVNDIYDMKRNQRTN